MSLSVYMFDVITGLSKKYRMKIDSQVSVDMDEYSFVHSDTKEGF